MSIQASTKGIIDFFRRNNKLIEEIMETAEGATADLENLTQRLSDARSDAQDAIENLRTTKFKVADATDTKEQQQALFEALSAALEKVKKYQDDPLRRGIYSGELSRLYAELAKTYDDTVRTIVTFTNKDVADFETLLQNCAVDTAKRNTRAALLDSAVQLSKLVLRFAAKVAAA